MPKCLHHNSKLICQLAYYKNTQLSAMITGLSVVCMSIALILLNDVNSTRSIEIM